MRVLWLVIGLAFLVLDAFAVPVLLCFNYQPSGALAMLFTVVSVYFIADIPTNCFVRAEGRDGQLIKRPFKLALLYARRWYVVDFIASIPWDWFASSSSSQGKLTRLVRLLRILRVIRLIKIASVFQFMIEFFSRNNTILLISKLFMMLSYPSLILHWIACGWFAVGNLSPETSWFNLIPKSFSHFLLVCEAFGIAQERVT